MSNLDKKVKRFFERNESTQEVHSTSDDLLFKEKHHADAHGNSLKDKRVQTHSRSFLESLNADFDQVATDWNKFRAEEEDADKAEAKAKAKAEEAEEKAKAEADKAEAKAKAEAEEAEEKAKAEAEKAAKKSTTTKQK